MHFLEKPQGNRANLSQSLPAGATFAVCPFYRAGGGVVRLTHFARREQTANHEVTMRKNIATLFAAASMAVAGISITGCNHDNNKDPDMTGATHGGVRAGQGTANPSGSPSLSGSHMGASGTTGTTG